MVFSPTNLPQSKINHGKCIVMFMYIYLHVLHFYGKSTGKCRHFCGKSFRVSSRYQDNLEFLQWLKSGSSKSRCLGGVSTGAWTCCLGFNHTFTVPTGKPCINQPNLGRYQDLPLKNQPHVGKIHCLLVCVAFFWCFHCWLGFVY